MFVITNEHGESTKRPEAELRGRTVGELIEEFQKLALFVGHTNLTDLAYVDSAVAIHLQAGVVPHTVFPRLTYPIASNVPLSVSAMVRLALVQPDSPLVERLTIAVKHARGLLPSLRLTFPLRNGGTSVAECVKAAVEGAVWEQQIAVLAGEMHAPPEQVLLIRRIQGSDVLLLPFMDVASVIGDWFDDGGAFRGSGEFFYEIVPEKDTWSDLPKVVATEFRVFEDDVADEVGLLGSSNFLPILTQNLIRLIREGDLKRNTANVLVERLLVRLCLPVVCGVAKKMNLGISNWKALSEWAKTLKRPSILEANIDFEKDPCDALAKLAVAMIAMRDDFADMYTKTCWRYVEFFKERDPVPQTTGFGGAIVFAANVVIGAEEVCLVLTRGFVYVLKGKMKGDKRFVFLPDRFDCLDFKTVDVLFMIPLTQWEAVPVSEERRTTVVLVSRDGMFQIQFSDATREVPVMFWILYLICKVEVHRNYIVTRLGDAEAAIELSYPRISDSFQVHAALTVRNHHWEITLNPAVVATSVVEAKTQFRLHKVPDTAYTDLATIYTGLSGFPCRSTETISHAQLLNAVKVTSIFHFGIEEAELAHCLLHEMIFSRQLSLVFTGFMLLKLSDFTFAIQRSSTELLDLQLTQFHSMLPYFSIYGVPLLHYACLTAKNSIYIHLIVKWCGVSIVSASGRSSLFYALDNPRLSIAQTLIDEGVDIDASESNGISPLIYCFQKNDMQNAEFLLRNGAKAHQIHPPKYNSALVYAILNRQLEAVKVLLPYCSNEINWPLEDGIFLTHLCLKSKMTQALKLLENIPCYDPNAYSCYYPPPLQYLLTLHRSQPPISELMSLLALCRLNLDSVDQNGNTLLSVAVKRGWTEIVDILAKDSRCDRNHWDQDGKTPLFVAVSKNSTPICTTLIKSGALVDMPNRDGSTPLHLAVEKGATEIVTLLLANGARPNRWYFNGRLPIHLASPQIKELLKKYGANEEAPQITNL